MKEKYLINAVTLYDEIHDLLATYKARKQCEFLRSEAWDNEIRAVENVLSLIGKIPFEKPFPAWRNPETDPPKIETEVLILYRMDSSRCDITTAIYEDGTLCTGESRWAWYDADNFDYDEEKDDYKIPKGWWEDRHFCPDDVYNNVVDFPVVGWMPLPPKEVAQNGNQQENP
jgi:hypothetical protein